MRRYGSDIANGTMLSQQIVVQVRWEWIAAHIAFIVLCLLLLVSTMIATHLSVLRRHAWKSSTSAVLHALSPSLQQEAGGILTESESKSFDREQLVRLRNTEGEGWRLQARDDK